MLTIASLTLREAVRRRLVLVAAFAGAIIAGLSAWGVAKIVSAAPERAAGLAIVATLTIFLAFVLSVVLAVGAAFLAAPAIANELDSGIALAILPRPLSRADYVLGKWLGLVTLVAGYAIAFGAVELGAIRLVSGYTPPHPVLAAAYLIAESIVLVTLALALSTRLSPVAGGLIAVLSFGVAWIAGITASIATALNNANLIHATTVVALLMPSDLLWRGAVYALQPVVFLAASDAASGRVNPFGASAPPPAAFIAWTIAWIVAMLAIAVGSFTRRDI